MKWIIALLFLLLSSCSNLPTSTQNTHYLKISLNEVRTNISAYYELPFRWGGKIINVSNKETSSQIQILFYPLNNYDRPQINTPTQGRFAITSPNFLDPAIYKEGTELTVTGILKGEITQIIGEKTLILPLLSVEAIYIWPQQRQQYNDRYRPYFYPHHPYYP